MCLVPSYGIYQGSETSTEAERVLVEDVFDAVEDLVELIKTFESKNRLSQIICSSLFKRRVEEAEALIDSTIVRLQVRLAKWYALVS